MNTDTTSIVRPASNLAALASQINAEHTAAAAAFVTGIDRARACGELLLHAKRLCAHGQWLPWLERNCPGVGNRQAQKYMRLARNWEKLKLANANSGAHLPINAALAELAAPAITDDDVPELPHHVADWLAAGREVLGTQPGFLDDGDSDADFYVVRLVPSATHPGYVFVGSYVGSEQVVTKKPVRLAGVGRTLKSQGITPNALAALEWCEGGGAAAENPWLDRVWAVEPVWKSGVV